MKKYFDLLLRGTFLMAPKPGIYLILAGWAAAYSERLNGANVEAELAGDWILVPTILLTVLGIVSLVVNVLDAVAESRETKARQAAAKARAEEAAKEQLLKS